MSRGQKILDILAAQNRASQNLNNEPITSFENAREETNLLLEEALQNDVILSNEDYFIADLSYCGPNENISTDMDVSEIDETRENILIDDISHLQQTQELENITSADDITNTSQVKIVDYDCYSSTDSSDSNDNENSEPGGKERKKKRNKRRRQSGKTYLNYKNQRVESKIILPNPCRSRNCTNKCNEFTEQERKEIFTLFWNMTSNVEKKNFINGCVNIIPIKRKRTLAENSRRSLTCQYFLMKENCQVQVCLQFLLSTLNISQKLVRNSLAGKIKANTDNRGKHAPKHKATEEQINELRTFIGNLPLVPSHYCRASTKKLYLPADVKNYSNLYRMYASLMEKKGKTPLGNSVFRKVFNRDFNIGIHVPRKDKCVKCERFKNLAEEEKTDAEKKKYLEHQKDKETAKQLFLSEQHKSTAENFLVVSFDLQKVLATPHGPNMMFGFSRKYAVYNFTVYESKTQNAYCYLWEEKDGKRGVNEIGTNLYNYLFKVDRERIYQSISLYCDNCPGQNKNRFILGMLQQFLYKAQFVRDISVTYLVTGHTYMPVDSVHATIERYTSNVNIQAPSEWSTMIRNARKRPRPYEIIPVHFADFLDWKSVGVPKKLKTAEGLEIKLADIKTAKLSKENLNYIIIATSYDPDTTFHKTTWPTRKVESVPRLYSSELPINKKKLKNLHDLCRDLTIKKQYHAEYFSLTSSASVPDELPETDIEDISDQD